MKEKDIINLNSQIDGFRKEIERRREEFFNQGKKLDSLAKNFNEMKMERAKLQRKLNKSIRGQNDEDNSQSCASLSDDSDVEETSERNSSIKKLRGSILEELKIDNSKGRAMITTIQESENEEEVVPHTNKVDLLNRGVTTVSKELGKLEYEDDSVSSNSKDGQSSTTYSNILKSKDSTGLMRRASTKTKEFMRMSTLKSDSSQGSSKFKFRAIKQKCNAYVQTDKQIFKLFLLSKMNQYILQSKTSRRNKIIQTEEVVSDKEEERRKELLANYGHKMYSSGDVNFRGVSNGGNSGIKYSNQNNSKQRGDVINAILAKSIQLINPIKSLKKKNEKPPKANEFLQISPRVESSTLSPPKSRHLKKQESVNIKIDPEEENIAESLSRPTSNYKRSKMKMKNNTQNMSMNSFKIDKISGTQDSRNECESLSHLSKRSSKKDKIKQVSFNENSDNISASCANQIQNSRRNSKFEPFFDQL